MLPPLTGSQSRIVNNETGEVALVQQMYSSDQWVVWKENGVTFAVLPTPSLALQFAYQMVGIGQDE